MPLSYPSLTTILPTTYVELDPQWPGARTEYQDGGIDTVSLSDTPVRRWAIAYENITTSERDTFKTLANSSRYNSKEGSLIPMTFTPRGESAVTVYFDEGGYQPSSIKSWIHSVTVKLVKLP